MIDFSQFDPELVKLTDISLDALKAADAAIGKIIMDACEALPDAVMAVLMGMQVIKINNINEAYRADYPQDKLELLDLAIDSMVRSTSKL